MREGVARGLISEVYGAWVRAGVDFDLNFLGSARCGEFSGVLIFIDFDERFFYELCVERCFCTAYTTRLFIS